MALPRNTVNNNDNNNGDDNDERIQLLDRCALCLEKASSPKDRTGRGSTRQKRPSKLSLSLKSFDINNLWYLITANVESDNVCDNDMRLGATKSNSMFQGQGSTLSTVAAGLPSTVPVCESCEMNLSKLQNLYSEFLKIKESLQAQVKTVRNVITQSGTVQGDRNFCGRLKTLHEDLQRSSLNNEPTVSVTPNSVQKTLEFLCRLRGQPPPPPATQFLSNDDDDSGDLHLFGDDDDDPSKGQEEVEENEDVKDVKPDIEDSDEFEPKNDPGDSNSGIQECNSNSEYEASDNGSNDDDSSDYEPPVKLKKKLKSTKMGTKRKTSPKKATEATEESPLKARAIGRRKRMNFYQVCEVCNQRCRCADMATHLSKEHGLKDFISPCPNPICDMVYFTPTRLKRIHLQTNKDCLEAANLTLEDVTILKCDSCKDYQTKNKFLFRQHLINSHESGESKTKPFQCPLAPPTGNCELKLSFNKKQSVEMHLIEKHLCTRKLTLDRKRKCYLCLDFINPSQMEHHLRNDHGVQEIFKCRQCPFVFDTWERLMAHKRFLHSFRGDQELSCDLCPVGEDEAPPMFPSISSLRSHYFKSHGLRESEKLFKCDKCDQAFPTPGLLKTHKKQEKLDEIQEKLKMGLKRFSKTEIVRCEQCPSLAFRSQEALDTHNVRCHGGTSFQCPHCHRFYDSEPSFRRHVREKHDPNRKPTAKHICEKCGKEFRCPSFLAHHDEIFHQGKKNSFQCTECEKSFRYKNGLRQHVKTAHENVRNHVCATCGMAFAQLSQLKQHTRVHSGEKPFACGECGKKFTQKGSLIMHRKIHTKARTGTS